MKEIEPTEEDWRRAEERIRTTDADHALMRRLARSEARERIERERRHRRRHILNRLSLGLIARR